MPQTFKTKVTIVHLTEKRKHKEKKRNREEKLTCSLKKLQISNSKIKKNALRILNKFMIATSVIKLTQSRESTDHNPNHLASFFSNFFNFCARWDETNLEFKLVIIDYRN